MKIISINPMSNFRTNFNGLWGKESTDNVSRSYYDSAQMCEMGTNHTVTTKTYYPFKDEDEKSIKTIIKNNQKVDSFAYHTEFDNSDNIVEYKVKVMPKLDITEGEYNKYNNDDLLSKDENRVEDILKLAGLKEYLLRNKRR